MLNAISHKHLHTAVIHPNRHGDNQRALRKLQTFSECGSEFQSIGRFLKLRHGETEHRGVQFIVHFGNVRHVRLAVTPARQEAG